MDMPVDIIARTRGIVHRGKERYEGQNALIVGAKDARKMMTEVQEVDMVGANFLVQQLSKFIRPGN